MFMEHITERERERGGGGGGGAWGMVMVNRETEIIEHIIGFRERERVKNSYNTSPTSLAREKEEREEGAGEAGGGQRGGEEGEAQEGEKWGGEVRRLVVIGKIGRNQYACVDMA